MKFFILLIFLLSFLNANETPYKLVLTKNDIKMIKNSHNTNFIIKRFKNYKQMVRKIQNYSLIQKLSYTNSFFNKILPKDDRQKYGMDDYWTTQKEFIINGKGDCEDYAIAKYFTLLELGIDKKKLYFAVVQVKGRNSKHMVLLYIQDKQSMPLILDNLSFKVVPLNKRKKLQQFYAFNEYKSYVLNKNKFEKEVKIDWGKENKWENLLHRVYSKKE